MSISKSSGRDENLILMSSSAGNTENSLSLLDTRIIPRSTSNLEHANRNWTELELIRNEKYKTEGSREVKNVYDITSMTKLDIDLTWTMIRNMFPRTEMLRKSDKSALLRNFMLKFWQLVAVFECIENQEFYENMTEFEYEKMIVSFYEGSFENGKELEREDILRTFRSYWDYTVFQTTPTILELKMDKKEWMAIVWLLVFDPAYTNISPQCQEMCRNIRKVILRELRNFQIDQDYEEMRFIDTLETLEIIEKLEKKFMEEMLICEMHNVKIHEDFKVILRENKF